jgi:cold shock CspA family protein
MSDERNRGRVRAFWPARRYGYITPSSDFSKEEFFHCNNFLPESDLPEVGAIVEYEIETQPNGRTHAINLHVISKSGGAR